MSDDPTDLAIPEEIDADGKEMLARMQTSARTARRQLETFVKELPSSQDFRNLGGMVVMDILLQIAAGELRYKNADEATKVAERVVKLVAGMDLKDLGDTIAAADDPKALLKELQATAAARATKPGS